jgi:hypothetical protein
VSFDLVNLLDHPTAVVGTTGAGKTFAAKGGVEALIRNKRSTIILDPVGAWWGLRAGATPKQAGLPVMIFGGEHADVPIAPTSESGTALGEALANRSELYAIVDTSEMTGGQKVRFLTPFLESLYARNRAVLHLIVDEADEIAAQRIADGEQRLFGIFDKIVRRGRIKGFRPLMITQRPAVIHKNVLSQVGTLIAMKLTSPQDRKAIDDWVKGNADADQAKEVMKSLPTLSRGEGWVWSPADAVLERTKFPAIGTFDSSKTPQPGDIVTSPALAPVDVEALRIALASPAEGETNTKPTSRAEIDRAYERGFAAGKEVGFKEGKSEGYWRGSHSQMIRIVDALSGAAMINGDREALEEALKRGQALKFEGTGTTPGQARPPAPAVEVLAEQPQKPLSVDPASLPGGNALLEVAFQIWPAKMTWVGLAAACGRKARGGHFNTQRKNLLSSGVLREDGNLVVPTNPPARPSGVAPADLLEQHLPQPAQKMFVAIRRTPGMSIVDLALALGMQPRGGHWNTGMSLLRKNGLIVDHDGLRIADGLEATRNG